MKNSKLYIHYTRFSRISKEKSCKENVKSEKGGCKGANHFPLATGAITLEIICLQAA